MALRSTRVRPNPSSICLAGALLALGLVASSASADVYRTLTVGSYTPGGGTVASYPDGLSCEVGGFSCDGQFPFGSAVAVTAPPNKGFAFSGFGGDCSGPSCVLTMDADKKVTVDFVRFAPLGKLRRNRRKGTGLLTIRVGGPGTLVVAGRRAQRQEVALASDANVKVPIVAKGGALRALRRRGSAKVGVRVSFTPEAGTTARFSRQIWLYQAKSRMR